MATPGNEEGDQETDWHVVLLGWLWAALSPHRKVLYDLLMSHGTDKAEIEV